MFTYARPNHTTTVKRKVIIDMDTGADDASALILAARNPNIEILGVTVLAGNVDLEQGTKNALMALEVAGVDAKVYKGSDTNCSNKKIEAFSVFGKDGMASKRLDTPFGIVDLSLAPTSAKGDSVARILEEMGLEICGTHGTTAALALLNDAVKKGGVMASSSVGGLSGAFIPVSEDEGMIEAAKAGTLCLDKLEAMTCVCSVGLDMIAIPGSTTAETISAIIADEAAIGMINNKTTAVRVLPTPGKDIGDVIEMGGLLGTAPVMPVHKESSYDFIHRGGHIPAPIHSLRN